MTMEFAKYADVTIAVVGLVQGVFLFLLLRAEGMRAFAANRWMMLFIGGVMINLFEDVIELFADGRGEGLMLLFFFPANFLIAPAIYLYFREISGTPSYRPWVHFLLAGLIFNLMAWLVTMDGGQTAAVSGDTVILSSVIESFCWFAIMTQIAIYIMLIWQVSRRYFRQTQTQLGADRHAMQRWMVVILGGVSLIFVTVITSKITAFYLPEDMAMTGTGVAFVLVLFAMSYVIATQPVLFVMADWPDDDVAAPVNATIPVPDNGTSGVSRPLLDDEGIVLARRRLDDIRKQGDLLFDPLVSLPKLARAVGISPNQLSYVLNRHVGQNFFDYVNNARIDEARAVLLAEPDRTILDIALSVGFNSKSTFNLAFRKLTGETPSAIRATARNAVANDLTEPAPRADAMDETGQK
ncbi:MAG: helix-turn-helix domain-containing protein [Pseudomonadota bacterium]